MIGSLVLVKDATDGISAILIVSAQSDHIRGARLRFTCLYSPNLNSIFNNTQHFAVYVRCMPSAA